MDGLVQISTSHKYQQFAHCNAKNIICCYRSNAVSDSKPSCCLHFYGTAVASTPSYNTLSSQLPLPTMDGHS